MSCILKQYLYSFTLTPLILLKKYKSVKVDTQVRVLKAGDGEPFQSVFPPNHLPRLPLLHKVF